MFESPIQIHRKNETPEDVVLRNLTLEEVESGIVSLMHKGRWRKADLSLVHAKGLQIVLKDFSKKSFFIKFLGCLQIWRESRAYGAIQNIPGIPKFYKQLGPYAFIMEHIEGVWLVKYKGEIPLSVLLEDLKRLVDSIHQYGVFHNDIRGRENVVVSKDGHLILLDFAGAIYFKPGSFFYKILSPLFRWVDHSAYLKWKSQLTPENMNAEEKRRMRKFNALRKFWFFNLKR